MRFVYCVKIFSILFCILCLSCNKNDEPIISDRVDRLENDFSKASIQEVKDVFSKGYSSFTDLNFHKGFYYLVFRQGSLHAGGSDFGKIMLMKSSNFVDWDVEDTFEEMGTDFRDPKLLLINDTLSLKCYGNRWDKNKKIRYNFLFNIGKRTDNIKLSKKVEVNYWPWSFSYSKVDNAWYSLAYNIPEKIFSLVNTKNFGSFNESCNLSNIQYSPSEGRLLFTENLMYYLVRREGSTILGTAPVSNKCSINWTELPLQYLGGPAISLYKNRYLLIVGRDNYTGDLYSSENRTSIFVYDIQKKNLKRICILPSEGDTGYPGIVITDNLMYMSYYSSADRKGIIKTAKVRLNF